ncbi:MAG: hypothetical protein KDC87_19850 [Planctomycetes bacterium]|nr:hypothetical protein [Planctomycetota bacterium]MCB9870171.1 hypothetical protein [Planctomycetota bacterium]
MASWSTTNLEASASTRLHPTDTRESHLVDDDLEDDSGTPDGRDGETDDGESGRHDSGPKLAQRGPTSMSGRTSFITLSLTRPSCELTSVSMLRGIEAIELTRFIGALGASRLTLPPTTGR